MSAAAAGGAAPPPPASLLEVELEGALEIADPDARVQACRSIIARAVEPEQTMLAERAARAVGLRPSSLLPPSPTPAMPAGTHAGVPANAPQAAQQPPAAPPEPPVEASNEVEKQDVAPAEPPEPLERLAYFRRLGSWLATAEGDPTAQAGATAALRFVYADALGLPLSAAAELIAGDSGRIVPSALLLRALAERVGLQAVPIQSTDETCTAALVDVATGHELGRATFTIAQAQRAGLTGRKAWTKYPADMLWARASSRAITTYAPAAAIGLELVVDRGGLGEAAPRGVPPPGLDFHGELDEHAVTDGAYNHDEEIPF